MKKAIITTITCKMLIGILTLLGLKSCKTNLIITDDGRKLTPKERREELKRLEAAKRDSIEQERIGRAVCLYGAPPPRQERIILPE